jgi:hypothetical protein
VKEFQYLGSIVTCDDNMNMEINHRIMKGNKCYYGLQKLFRSKPLKKETKERIYKTIINPVILYGGESWILKVNEEKLKSFERNIIK